MDYYEIDFLEVGDGKSGDAIALRYGGVNVAENVHVVDGGYTDDGQRILNHATEFYDQKNYIDHVVLTHSDTDHACGLKTVISEGVVGNLWMNRPWSHIDELLPMFEQQYTRDGLIQRLKNEYPHVAELESMANERGIPVHDAFQGADIGSFKVLAPSKNRYLIHVVESEKTPESGIEATFAQVGRAVVSAVRSIAALWGHENLKGDTEGTSHENEMSVVQYASLAGHKILLTGDAGIRALDEAHTYATQLGLLPGIMYFQVPHHGSRRNLSSAILDKWFGPVLQVKPTPGSGLFKAIISASGTDEDHPRKAVMRALIHRGADISSTKNAKIHGLRWNKPVRTGWGATPIMDYPSETEE